LDAHVATPNEALVGRASPSSLLGPLSNHTQEFFTYLQNHGLYESDALEDRVVFLFIFIPILRSEISTYVETWNAHQIRPQKARPNHIAGVPNDLYTDRSLPRYGWTPDVDLLAQLTEAVKDVSKASL
jgi:hypothetical protein